VKTIEINLGVIEVVELLASYAKIHGATKIRILFFYPFTVRFSQEEENRQSEKLHLTLKVLRGLERRINFLICLSLGQ
jgi:hypothetical protein